MLTTQPVQSLRGPAWNEKASAMKQSPIRRLRRDRSRLAQELQLAQGTGDTASVPVLEKKIRDLDKEIDALVKKREAGDA